MGARREALKPPKRATRRQRRIVQVVAEGETELDYLRLNSVRALIRDAGDVSLSIVDHHKGQTDPASLVKTMTSKGRGPRDLQRNDEQWLVMDVDEWTPGQMRKAVEWASKDQRRGLAISNPKFEAYLLLHFPTTGRPSAGAHRVETELKRHMPDGFKRLAPTTFTGKQVITATTRSRELGANDKKGMPDKGLSSFHLLVESLITRRG